MEIKNFNSAQDLQTILNHAYADGQRVKLLGDNALAVYNKPSNIFGRAVNWLREVTGINRREHERVVGVFQRLVDAVPGSVLPTANPTLRERTPSFSVPSSSEEARSELGAQHHGHGSEQSSGNAQDLPEPHSLPVEERIVAEPVTEEPLPRVQTQAQDLSTSQQTSEVPQETPVVVDKSVAVPELPEPGALQATPEKVIPVEAQPIEAPIIEVPKNESQSLGVEPAVVEPLPQVQTQAQDLSTSQQTSEVPQETPVVVDKSVAVPEPEALQATPEKVIPVEAQPIEAPIIEVPKNTSTTPPPQASVAPEPLWGAAELYMFKMDLKEALEAYLNKSPNLTPKELQMVKGTIGQLQASNPNLHTIKVRLHLIPDLAKEGGLLSQFKFPDDKVRPAANKPKPNAPESGGVSPNTEFMDEDFSRRAQILKDKFGKQAHPDFIKLVIDYRNTEIPKGNPFAMAVSDIELFALLRYGGGAYKQVNALLRNDHNRYYDKSSETMAIALYASSALQKLESAGIINRSLVHRGIHNYKGFVDKQEGDTFKEDGFTSTSRSTQVLDAFAKFTDQAETDPTVFRMFTKGVPLDPKVGFIKVEEEVLIAPNSEHKILFKGQRPAFDSNGQFLKDVTEIVTEQVGVDPHQGHSESNQWIIDSVLEGFDDLEKGLRTRNPADPRRIKDDGDI